MRVAFCIDNMNVGGTELNALRTARHLRRRGVELRVFSLAPQGPLLAEYRDLGVPVTTLPIPGLLRPAALRAGRMLLRELRRYQIRIVHAHDFYSNVFAAPWVRAGGAAFIASRRWWEGSSRLRRLANRGSYALATRVLANSPMVARLLHEREKVPLQRIVVVPNFLDEEAFQDPPGEWRAAERRRLQLAADALVVGSVGSLSPVKDHATLLRACALLANEFPRLHAVLVGRDAGSASQLARLAHELGFADRTRFAGQRPQHPSAHYLFDVATLTSVSEGMPNAVLEAMAAARPIVATDVGAVRDAVVMGVTGAVVPPRDPGALARALRPLLAEPALRQQMGRAGRDRARHHYSAEAAIGALLDVYRALL